MMTRDQLIAIRDSDVRRFENAGRVLDTLIEEDPILKMSLAVQIFAKRLGMIAITAANRRIQSELRDSELAFAILRETHEAFKYNSGFVVAQIAAQVDELVKPYFDALTLHALFEMQAPDDAGSNPGGAAAAAAAPADAGTAGQDVSPGSGGPGAESPAASAGAAAGDAEPGSARRDS